MGEYTIKQFQHLINNIKQQKQPYHKKPAVINLQNTKIDNKLLLTEKHILLLTDALDNNPNVAILNLKGTKISYPALEILKEHVFKNHFLQTIQVDCMFSEEGKNRLENDIHEVINVNNKRMDLLCRDDFLLATKKTGLSIKSLSCLKKELKDMTYRNAKCKKELKSLDSLFKKIPGYFSKKAKESQKTKRKELYYDHQFMSNIIAIIALLIENKEKKEQLDKVNGYYNNIKEINDINRWKLNEENLQTCIENEIKLFLQN